MAMQYSQEQCLECQRKTLHVRNTYDVPHWAYLNLTCFGIIAALIVRDEFLVQELGIAAAIGVIVWLIHAVAAQLVAVRPFRCQQCGTAATARGATTRLPAQQLPATAVATAPKQQASPERRSGRSRHRSRSGVRSRKRFLHAVANMIWAVLLPLIITGLLVTLFLQRGSKRPPSVDE